MIPPWLRTTIILVLLIVWSGYVIVQLIRKDSIDSLVWGVPGGFLLILGPSLKGGGNDDGKRK